MQLNKYVVLGLAIAVSAFLFDWLGFTLIARPVFYVGFLIGLFGVFGAAFGKNSFSEYSSASILLFRMGLIGFAIAIGGIGLTALGTEAKWIYYLINTGGFMFIGGAILSTLFAKRKS